MARVFDVSSLPRAARPLVSRFSIAFSAAVFQRVLVLLVGAVLAGGRRTVAACLWAARAVARGTGDSSSYRRVFSHASWSPWPLGRVLGAAALALVPPGEPVIVGADDTVAQHRGKKVYGKGRHRDAVRSSHRAKVRKTDWYDKPEPTFADAMRAVRRLFWAETVLTHPHQGRGFEKLPRRLKDTLLDYLSEAA